jgi:hypothetical protein
MLMLTMRECFGQKPREGLGEPRPMEVRQRGFVTRLSLREALERIRAYEVAFKQRYDRVGNWIEFELLHVGSIDDLDEEAIELARVVHVEMLDKDIAEMNKRLDG